MGRRERRQFGRRLFGRKKIQQWKIAILFAVLGFSLLSFGAIFTIPKLLATIRQDDIPITVEDWDGNDRLTIVLPGDPVRLLALTPGESVVAVEIPGDTMVNVPHGYGAYRVSAVDDLGVLDPILGGPRLLMHTMQELFGIPIDGYLDLRSVRLKPPSQDPVAVIRQLIKSPTRWSLHFGVRSSFAIDDLLRFFWHVAWIRFDRVSFLSLDREEDTERIVSAVGGSRATEARRPRVAVLNGTTHPGLAAAMARYAEHAGGAVVAVGNAQEQGPHSTIMGNRASSVTQQLAAVMGQICPERCTIQSAGSDVYDVDIAIIVGEDYWTFLHGKTGEGQ